jgi:hypothetical protein
MGQVQVSRKLVLHVSFAGSYFVAYVLKTLIHETNFSYHVFSIAGIEVVISKRIHTMIQLAGKFCGYACQWKIREYTHRLRQVSRLWHEGMHAIRKRNALAPSEGCYRTQAGGDPSDITPGHSWYEKEYWAVAITSNDAKDSEPWHNTGYPPSMPGGT